MAHERDTLPPSFVVVDTPVVSVENDLHLNAPLVQKLHGEEEVKEYNPPFPGSCANTTAVADVQCAMPIEFGSVKN